MSSSKRFMVKFQPGFDGLWFGEYFAHEKVDDEGNRIITVELLEECELDTPTLASEISQISTKDVLSATLVPSCSRLVVELHPGSDVPAKKILKNFSKDLTGHLRDLPPDRRDALNSTTWPTGVELETEPMSRERITNAMATSSPIGFNDRGR